MDDYRGIPHGGGECNVRCVNESMFEYASESSTRSTRRNIKCVPRHPPRTPREFLSEAIESESASPD